MLLLLLASICCFTAYAEPEKVSVYMDNGKATFVVGKLDNQAAAFAQYNDMLLTKGWNVLDVKAGYDNVTSDRDLMYAAGFAEGVVTARDLSTHFSNLHSIYPQSNQSLINKTDMIMKNFFNAQDIWMRGMIKKYGDNDPYWRHASYVVAQLDGLYDGYVSVSQPHWIKEKYVVQYLNGVGDLIDLRNALIPTQIPNFEKMSAKEILHHHYTHGHCSALIKATGAFEDVFMSHVSWFLYTNSFRIYKHYDFNLKDEATASQSLSFSSYPGFLESLDDFYIMNNGLVMLQTTNNIYNKDLYKLIKPESMLAWQRVRIANHMAKGGKQWSDVLSKYNSGTYNNQYMVLDLNKVHLNKGLDDNALWVVEQIPGLVKGADQTPLLRLGYWPSYNVPFYEEIYNKSGYPEISKTVGTDLSYSLAPRAKIFRRDQGKVINIKDMQALMRSNDFHNDPYSDGNPWNAICSRGDLASDAVPHGCYDGKVTSYNMALNMHSYAISGPTLALNLPPFSWTKKFSTTPHAGLPQSYNFTWVAMKPSL